MGSSTGRGLVLDKMALGITVIPSLYSTTLVSHSQIYSYMAISRLGECMLLFYCCETTLLPKKHRRRTHWGLACSVRGRVCDHDGGEHCSRQVAMAPGQDLRVDRQTTVTRQSTTGNGMGSENFSANPKWHNSSSKATPSDSSQTVPSTGS